MNKMEKSIINSINYECSDTIEMQGKRESISKYLNRGYYIKEERNGYWVLVKPAHLYVTLTTIEATITLNMKEYVCEYYGRKRISKSLIEKFEKDIRNDNVNIYMDSHGNYTLK